MAQTINIADLIPGELFVKHDGTVCLVICRGDDIPACYLMHAKVNVRKWVKHVEGITISQADRMCCP